MKKQTSSLMSYGESLPESISNQITRTATQIITNCATYEYNYSEDASVSRIIRSKLVIQTHCRHILQFS